MNPIVKLPILKPIVLTVPLIRNISSLPCIFCLRQTIQGKEDAILNYEVAIMTVNALRELGRKADLTIYDNGTHALVNSDVVTKVEAFVRTRAPGKINVLKTLVSDVTNQLETISNSLNTSVSALSVFLGRF